MEDSTHWLKYSLILMKYIVLSKANAHQYNYLGDAKEVKASEGSAALRVSHRIISKEGLTLMPQIDT